MVAWGVALLALGAAPGALQQPAAPYVPKQSDRPAPADGDVRMIYLAYALRLV